MDLHNKTILITGGARVGHYVARELAQAGATILMTYLKDPSEVEGALAEVAALGQKTAALPLDLSREESVPELTQKITADWGQLNGLVNMASVFLPDQPEPTFADLQKMFSINTFGTMLLSHWFATQAKAHTATNAPIVSFIDWAVDHPYSKYAVYVASKAALRHYLMALQTSHAGTIRVVNIHPGMILEPLNFPANEKEVIINNTPVKDIGDPTQAAKLVRTALELDYWVDNVYLAGGQQWRHRLS